MKMHSSILTLMLVMTPAFLNAGKTPPPAPNLAASLSLQVSVLQTEKEPAPAVADVSQALKFTHSFTLTGEQEAALQSDTTINAFGVSFTLGEDPNFQNGDKSATITKMLPGLIGPPFEGTIKTKWNKGKFTISVTGKNKQQIVLAPLALKPEKVLAPFGYEERTEIVNGTPRAENVISLTTLIDYAAITDLTIEAPLATDQAVTISSNVDFDGTIRQSQQVNYKTKYFVNP